MFLSVAEFYDLFTLLSILNNLIAPSGIFCDPDSHLAHVRAETSTCLLACARERPRVFRSAFSSFPCISA